MPPRRDRNGAKGVVAPDAESNVPDDQDEEVSEPPRGRRRLEDLAFPDLPVPLPAAPAPPSPPRSPLPPVSLVPPVLPVAPPPPVPQVPPKQVAMAEILQRLDTMQRDIANLRREQLIPPQAPEIPPQAPEIPPPAPIVPPVAPIVPADAPAPPLEGRRQIPEEGISMFAFLKLNLPVFRGTAGEDPTDYLDGIDVTIQRLRCSDVRIIELMALLLKDRALAWYRQYIEARIYRYQTITWAEFRKKMTEEFLTAGERESRVVQFERLVQG